VALLDLDAQLKGLNSLLKEDLIFRTICPGGLVRRATGVYDGGFNLGNHLNMLRRPNGKRPYDIESFPFMAADKKALDEGTYDIHATRPNDSGVADTVEQILEYYKEQIDDPDTTYVIDATLVKRDLSNKGQGGGWRWHKWGEYIGTQTPTTEYLDDEPEIEQVLVFHLYKITEVFR
jgi:hypothetical protein